MAKDHIQVLVEAGYVYDVDRVVARRIKTSCNDGIAGFVDFIDIYGADCNIRIRSICGFREHTDAIGARYKEINSEDEEKSW